MSTVTIYKITVTKAYMMAEQGSRFGLRPWGGNTEYYEGFDDGGTEYVLPEVFEAEESNTPGTLEIYVSDYPCTLTNLFGTPALIDRSGGYHRLKAA